MVGRIKYWFAKSEDMSCSPHHAPVGQNPVHAARITHNGNNNKKRNDNEVRYGAFWRTPCRCGLLRFSLRETWVTEGLGLYGRRS